MNFILDSIDEAAGSFLHIVQGSKVIALHGDIGAGKTTFIKAICRKAGVLTNVSSPTFSIINEYLLPGGGSIYHMDLYRIENNTEAIDAGVDDCLLSGNICFVEWPENAFALLPPDTVHCYLLALADNERKLQINL